MTVTVQAEAVGPEYVTDVAYLRNFVEDLAPPRLRLCAALNGFTPPPAEGFAYGELGCGNGDTLATLAAAHPLASFVGVDMNPEHVAFAEGLASRGGLANARFLADDFDGRMMPQHVGQTAANQRMIVDQQHAHPGRNRRR